MDRDGALPSSDQYSSNYTNGSFAINDKDDDQLAIFRSSRRTDGIIYSEIYARNTNINNNSTVDNFISIGISNTGVRSYQIADPKEFRDAIGLNTDYIMWRNTSPLPNNTNVDNLLYNFNVYQISDITKLTNMPSGAGSWGWLINLYFVQIYLGSTGNYNMYIRRYAGTKWDPWIRYTGTQI